jgi:argininosuccinate lyase
VTLVDAAIRTAEFNVARLEARAAEGGTTLTELADHLVRTRGLSFKTAHTIVSSLLASRRDHPDLPFGVALAQVSGEILGSPLQYSDAEIETIISPKHFVDARRTLDADRRWLTTTRDSLAAADARLRERSRAL